MKSSQTCCTTKTISKKTTFSDNSTSNNLFNTTTIATTLESTTTRTTIHMIKNNSPNWPTNKYMPILINIAILKTNIRTRTIYLKVTNNRNRSSLAIISITTHLFRSTNNIQTLLSIHSLKTIISPILEPGSPIPNIRMNRTSRIGSNMLNRSK